MGPTLISPLTLFGTFEQPNAKSSTESIFSTPNELPSRLPSQMHDTKALASSYPFSAAA